MQIAEQIRLWSAEVLEPGVFVVDVEQKANGGKLLVLIDADGSLTIEQCRALNRHLSARLDESDYGDTPYTLEVSSPGVDRPLILKRQYDKHIGRELKVKLKAQTELLGRLEGISGDRIHLLLKDKKKGYGAKEPTLKDIAFDDIEETTVQVTFN